MDTTREHLSTALADRYRIERELGEGGMATVYLAEDLRHDRQVALKVLKPELAAVLGAERFIQEIKTTANLSHPHILPLFDSGAADGFLYYVMPYMAGETLREKLDREGQLSIDDTLEITRVISAALDFAHRRAIIHRDLKPENILFQDGVPILADFGIAVALATAGGDRLTRTGMSPGTPAYMSPEQAAGERGLDARSDVYALGCLTYEMLAGEPPFGGRNAAAIMARHMIDTAPPITTVRRNVSTAVASALAAALQKVPADRPASAGAFAAALRGEGTATADEPPTLVVLPFVNRSQEPDHEFFSDGLTEEVIADLSNVRALRVISRNSAMTLKGTTKDTPTLARELGVTHVVTGSVRRAANALRVTAELVEARTDTPVWSEKYAGTVEDVFGIQEEIARKIVTALRMTLTEDEARRVAVRPVEDARAYDCYLRARQLLYAWTPDAPQRAVQFVDEAIGIVGETPLLLALKAQLQWNEVNLNLATSSARLPQVLATLNRALALDPEHPLAIFVRGLVAGGRGQPAEALPDLYRAHDTWPGDANILTQVCRFSNTAGLRDHGPLVDRLALLDPLSPVTPVVVATYHWANGRFAEAVEPARRSSAMAPPGSVIPALTALRLAAAGLREEASATLERALPMFQGARLAPGMHFISRALAGDRDGALRYVGPEMESLAQSELASVFTAETYAMIGQVDDALRWARKAVERGFINYPFLAEYDPFLADARRLHGFKQLLEEVRPRWEAVVEWERGRQPRPISRS